MTRAELRVEDLEEAVSFNTEVFGLTELSREDGRVYLTCGADQERAQLVLREGGTGTGSFTLSVDAEDDLEGFAERLRGVGVDTEVRTDAAPGQSRALAFSLPTGQEVELEARPERSLYQHEALDPAPQRHGVGASDIDHITIAFDDGAKAKATARVLTEGLGFSVSDVMLDPEGNWLGAWTRAGEYHHDVAMIRCQSGATLHHLAWTLDGADHLKTAADALARAGHCLETGPGRHGVGGNLYSYFWAPGGNRYELSAEMPRLVGRRSQPLVRSVAEFNAFSAWGTPRPESFGEGS
ncbi:MAG: VOC family protein [Actinobacteria bacterium]|nr:VOC family protein [Actinomycetota bacterium]